MSTENLKTVSGASDSAPKEAVRHEDAALKTAFRYFSDVLLPYFGIPKKAVRYNVPYKVDTARERDCLKC